MTRKLVPPDVYVKDTGTAKGRGVFAGRAFATAEVIEESAVVILLEPIGALPAALQKTVFDWGVLAKTANCYALALGFGSLYNSANPSNMRYEADVGSTMLRFIAVRDIAADEELTINYSAAGGGSKSPDNDWFKGHRVRARG